MTLDEAIRHSREKAKKLKDKATQEINAKFGYAKEDCLDCAKDHDQLALWLTELEQRRAVDEWVPVFKALPEKDGYYLVTRINNDVEIVLFTHISGFAWSNVIAWRPLPEPYKESKGNSGADMKGGAE